MEKQNAAKEGTVEAQLMRAERGDEMSDWLSEQQAKYSQGALQQFNPVGPGIGIYVPPTRRQQLEQRKKELEFMLDSINSALKAFDEHPELENFIDVIQKAGV